MYIFDMMVLLTINCLQIEYAEDEVETKEWLCMFVALVEDIKEQLSECGFSSSFSLNNITAQQRSKWLSWAYYSIDIGRTYPCSSASNPLTPQKDKSYPSSQNHSWKFVDSLEKYIDVTEFCLLNAIPSSQVKFIQTGLNIIVDLSLSINRILKVDHKRERFETFYYSKMEVIRNNMKPIMRFLNDKASEILKIEYEIGTSRLLEEITIDNEENTSNRTETDFSTTNYSLTPQSSNVNDSITPSSQRHDLGYDEDISSSKVSNRNVYLNSTLKEVELKRKKSIFPCSIKDTYADLQMFSPIVTNKSAKVPNHLLTTPIIHQKADYSYDNSKIINNTDKYHKNTQNNNPFHVRSYIKNDFRGYEGDNEENSSQRKNSQMYILGKKGKNMIVALSSNERDSACNIVPRNIDDHTSVGNISRNRNCDPNYVSVGTNSHITDFVSNNISDDSRSCNDERIANHVSVDSRCTKSENILNHIPDDNRGLKSDNISSNVSDVNHNCNTDRVSCYTPDSIHNHTTENTFCSTINSTFNVASNYNFDLSLKTRDHDDTAIHSIDNIQAENNTDESVEPLFDYVSSHINGRIFATLHSSTFDVNKGTFDPFIGGRKKYHTIKTSNITTETSTETHNEQDTTKSKKGWKTPLVISSCVLGIMAVSVGLFVSIKNQWILFESKYRINSRIASLMKQKVN